MSKKYAVLCTWSDYDCGSPCARIVNDALCNSWQEAYDVIVKDILDIYEVSSLDDLEYDYKLPDRDKEGSYTHKCGNAWVYDDDGETLYSVQTIMVD